MVRDTFILGNADIKDGTFTDPKLDPASNLFLLLNKLVEDGLPILALPVGAVSSVRLDLQLEAETPSGGPTFAGVIVGGTERHSIFQAGTDRAFPSGADHVCGVLTYQAPQSGYALSCTNLSPSVPYVGVSAQIAAGDTLKIFSGPTLIQTVTVTANAITDASSGTLTISPAFIGATGPYSGVRLARWILTFQVAETGGGFAFGGVVSMDVQLRKRLRIYEHSGRFITHSPPLTGTLGEVGGGGAVDLPARTKIDSIIAWMLSVGGGPVNIDSWRVQIHKHLEEKFIMLVPAIVHIKLLGSQLQTTQYTVDPGAAVLSSWVAEINLYRNGLEQCWGEDYTWDFQTDLITFTPASLAGEVFIVKEEIKCYDVLPLVPAQFVPGVPAPVGAGQPNVPPNLPVLVSQYEADKTTVVASGAVSLTDIIAYQVTLSDPDNVLWESDGVRLRLEVKQKVGAFTGVANVVGQYFENGGTGFVEFDSRTLVGDDVTGYDVQIWAEDVNGAITGPIVNPSGGSPDFLLASLVSPPVAFTFAPLTDYLEPDFVTPLNTFAGNSQTPTQGIQTGPAAMGLRFTNPVAYAQDLQVEVVFGAPVFTGVPNYTVLAVPGFGTTIVSITLAGPSYTTCYFQHRAVTGSPSLYVVNGGLPDCWVGPSLFPPPAWQIKFTISSPGVPVPVYPHPMVPGDDLKIVLLVPIGDELNWLPLYSTVSHLGPFLPLVVTLTTPGVGSVTFDVLNALLLAQVGGPGVPFWLKARHGPTFIQIAPSAAAGGSAAAPSNIVPNAISA